MTITRKPLTNDAYGVPRGRPRRIRPIALACIHITGNRRTATMPGNSGALAERHYANRAGSNGPSAHDYDDRDGNTIRAINPMTYAAWSNGDVQNPDTSNMGIRAVLALRAKGYNANEAYWLETEELGEPHTHPITLPQRRSLARRIAAISMVTGLAPSRNTIHGHYQINGVNRQNCPTLRPQHDAFLNDIVRRVKAEIERRTLAGLVLDVRALRAAHPVRARRYRREHPIPKRETRAQRIKRLQAEKDALGSN